MHETTMLQEDIVTMASAMLPWERLEHRCVLVTGATGLLGSLFIKTLLKRNELFDVGIAVLAHARNAEKAKRVFGELLDMPGLHLLMGDICESVQTEFPVDYIVHAASETASKAFIKTPVETIRTAIYGTERVLELAREKQVKSMVYLSSLEVYGVTDPNLPGVSEADYGYIDPLSVRSSYSESKRMAENLCVSYAQEYGVPVKIARLAQTFGAGVDADDRRVFAEFARSIRQGKDIVLHTKGETMHNYCYTTDAISGILTVLLKGQDAKAYNLANENAYLSIRDMAERMCACRPDAQSKVVLDLAQDAAMFGYAPTVKIKLLTKKAEALGWKAEVGIDEMLMRLIDGGRE